MDRHFIALKYATQSSKQENAYKLPGKQEDLHNDIKQPQQIIHYYTSTYFVTKLHITEYKYVNINIYRIQMSKQWHNLLWCTIFFHLSTKTLFN